MVRNGCKLAISQSAFLRHPLVEFIPNDIWFLKVFPGTAFAQAGSIKLAAAFLRQTSVVGTNIWRGVMARRWRGASLARRARAIGYSASPNWSKSCVLAYLSHCRRVQLAMIQSDTMKTSSTVPGQIVIKVFRTNRVLKLIRLSAPIEREEASVNNFECKSITLQTEEWVLLSGGLMSF